MESDEKGLKGPTFLKSIFSDHSKSKSNLQDFPLRSEANGNRERETVGSGRPCGRDNLCAVGKKNLEAEQILARPLGSAALVQLPETHPGVPVCVLGGWGDGQ